MPTYKLTYFEARGAAELPRLLFRIASVEFEDVRISREEWYKMKPEMPMQALPVLEIDGQPFCQSNAVSRYLAKSFNLMGSSLLDELRIDELSEVISEFYNRNFENICYEQDEAKRKENVATFVKEKCPVYLNFIERRLKENNDGIGFYIGNSVSMGDVLLYTIFYGIRNWLRTMGFDPLEASPLLLAHYNRIEALPEIAEWIKIRPESHF